MRMALMASFFAFLNSTAFCQDAGNPVAFDVASVKPSQRILGPGANNHITFAPAGITAKNATLRRLVAEAYRLQMNQILGPAWLDQREYDIEAKAGAPATKEQLARMLQPLLAERFKLTQHRETKELRAYELVVDKAGPKIHPSQEGEASGSPTGLHFHGDLRHFADLLAVQQSIALTDDPRRPGRASGPPAPVLDQTGLPGIYDFTVDIRPEPGADMFSLWQRVLKEQIGLRLDSRKTPVGVLVVDAAEQLPTST